MRFGRLGSLLLAVIGIAVGGYFEFFFKAASASSYRLQETLPKMVSDFGANARVVEISAGTDDVYFEVIGADGLLHGRDYGRQYSRVQGGGTGISRKVTNTVRRPTAAELRAARVRLGDISPGVVDELLAKVRFPKKGSSATLAGEDWTLESGARAFDKYAARYDGTGVHQTQSKASVFAPKATTAPAAAPTPTSTAQPLTVTVQTSVTKPQRLLACIERAHQDVNKIVACQRRFTP